MGFDGNNLEDFIRHACELEVPVVTSLFKVLWGDFNRYPLPVGLVLLVSTAFVSKALAVLSNYAIPFAITNLLDKRWLYF